MMTNSTEKIVLKLKEGASFAEGQFDLYRDNKEVVLEAIRQFSPALEYASSRLKDDKDVVLEAVKRDARVLHYASVRLKDDKEVVGVAMKQNHAQLSSASERLRDDKDIVLEAVRRRGLNLLSASARLANDAEVVSEAIKQDPSMQDYVARRNYRLELDKQRNEKGILTRDAVIKMLQEGFLFLDDDEATFYKDDKEVVSGAVRKNVHAYKYASERLKNDKEIALEVVKRDGFKLFDLPNSLLSDRDVLLEALKQAEVPMITIKHRLQTCGKSANDIAVLVQSVLSDVELKAIQDTRNDIKRKKDGEKSEGIIIGKNIHETKENLIGFARGLMVFIVIIALIIMIGMALPGSCTHNNDYTTPDMYYRR